MPEITHPVFTHPESGEVLDTKDDFRRALDEINWRMTPMWVVRRQIREAYAERFEPVLPKRRNRTSTQERVAWCPRCGGSEAA